MLIINNETSYQCHPVLRYLPSRIRRYISLVRINDAEEIRLRNGLPLMVNFSDKSYFVSENNNLTTNINKAVIVYESDIKEALELIVKSSLYTAENSLKHGFITIEGGNRIGVCGNCVISGGDITTINNINGFNYRIAKEINCANDSILNSILKNGKIMNTLIISPPCCGKTTLLRDIARNLSNRGYKVGIADERNEIAAMSQGIRGFDLGYCADVLEGAKKKDAFQILIRSMSPQVIITDELGKKEDYEAIENAMYSGVSVIASIHSHSRKSLFDSNFFGKNLFDCYITLNREKGPGTIGEIYSD